MKPSSTTSVYCGVDVAKAELVLDLAGAILRFPNTQAGLASLFARLRTRGAPASPHLVCEASGGYERVLVAAAQAAAVPVSVVMPGRVRAYAKALGLKAKNDPLDAALISRFAQATTPAPDVPLDPVRAELAELLTQRTALLGQKTMADNRAEHHRSALCRKQHRQLVALLEKQLAALDQAIAALIARTPALQAADTVLQAVCGVGPRTAATLLGHVPELGRVNRQEIAALAGLAPFDQDSGTHQGQRQIHGGRAPVRKVLYLAALTAASHNPVLKLAYAKFQAAGKPTKVALTALARKLLVHLNSLLAAHYQKTSPKTLAA